MVENKSQTQKISLIKKSLDGFVYGHDNMKRAVLLSLLSSEPTLVIGKVGIAKTYTVDTLAKMLNVNYYYVLLNKYTEPDHVLGILDINEYKKGRLVYHGGVVDANIVMFDEPYKSSPDVLNTLLDIILNNCIFKPFRIEYDLRTKRPIYINDLPISSGDNNEIK
jgi:MoxR-like ATPase